MYHHVQKTCPIFQCTPWQASLSFQVSPKLMTLWHLLHPSWTYPFTPPLPHPRCLWILTPGVSPDWPLNTQQWQQVIHQYPRGSCTRSISNTLLCAWYITYLFRCQCVEKLSLSSNPPGMPYHHLLLERWLTQVLLLMPLEYHLPTPTYVSTFRTLIILHLLHGHPQQCVVSHGPSHTSVTHSRVPMRLSNSWN